jgi:2-polyprenyl-3-methyl-5-hydroxy-6-metoxy-1,4-benzoquinol methylase
MTIHTENQLEVLVDELAASAWTLAAIGLFFDAGVADALREPRTLDELAARLPGLSRERIARCLAVAEVRGLVVAEDDRRRLAPGVLPFLEGTRRTVLQGDLRSYVLQPAEYLRAALGPEVESGWRFTDPVILQAQGDGSAMFAGAVHAKIAPALGLSERLERPGGAFLDVGAGVGALSIAMARTFPELRVVGLDASEAPLALARANVAAAGVAERVELRAMRVEDLRDEEAFDLAWLPAFFLRSRGVVRAAVESIRRALRPGGFLLIPAVNPSAGEAERAVWSLVLESWGGPVLDAPEVSRLAAEGGLAPRVLPGPSWVAMIAAKR